MSNENMMTINMSIFDLDCSIEVPVELFFEKFQLAPVLIDRYGFEGSSEEYLKALSLIQLEYENVENFSWKLANRSDQEFLMRCQAVAIMGAFLEGFPLLLEGDGLIDRMSALGGTEMTRGDLNYGQLH